MKNIDPDWFGDQIEAAAARLQGHARRTPLIRSGTVDRVCGREVVMKCENFQRTGAFKFRGAFNALSQLDDATRKAGVITHSSGNHAQALACAGRMLGIAVTVVMPDNAPLVKRAATGSYGAEIVSYDPREVTREELSARIAARRGLHLIPPYDHPQVIAGQGTAALETARQDAAIDMILVPTGGGGLLSGTAMALRQQLPDCRVIGVEPELADDAARSLHTRQLQQVRNPPTIADGVRTSSLGEWTFPIVLGYVDDIVTVSEEAIREAVRLLLTRVKIVVEPSGVLGVAALLSGVVPEAGRTAVILSGGNVDATTLAGILAG